MFCMKTERKQELHKQGFLTRKKKQEQITTEIKLSYKLLLKRKVKRKETESRKKIWMWSVQVKERKKSTIFFQVFLLLLIFWDFKILFLHVHCWRHEFCFLGFALKCEWFSNKWNSLKWNEKKD